jgi:hypothetical protein
MELNQISAFSASCSRINPCFTSGNRIGGLKLSRNSRAPENDHLHIYSLWVQLAGRDAGEGGPSRRAGGVREKQLRRLSRLLGRLELAQSRKIPAIMCAIDGACYVCSLFSFFLFFFFTLCVSDSRTYSSRAPPASLLMARFQLERRLFTLYHRVPQK